MQTFKVKEWLGVEVTYINYAKILMTPLKVTNSLHLILLYFMQQIEIV